MTHALSTGACASAAAQAAARLLLGAPRVEHVEFLMPDGNLVDVPILTATLTSDGAMASVRKPANDDPDITAGVEVVARIAPHDGREIVFAAGEGVGTVTKPGLPIPPGEPAINPVPRAMIRDAIRRVTDRPLRVEIAIPGGRELAARTFNPRLGIQGGLSILGTAGLVRPFSTPALRDALKAAFDVAAACGVTAPVLVPGRIGSRAARAAFRLAEEAVIEVGNEWGFALDEIARHDFTALLVVGHPGKIVKLAVGEWDTHSARTRPAVEIARELLGWVGGIEEGETVEGLFTAMAEEARRAAAERVAARAAAAISERIDGGAPVAVALVGRDERIMGTSGDLAPWQ
jgi:cobalt-precorrin-5B (C1)-methyltransferase